MGVLILGIISSFILINAAAILHPQGIQVNSATDMGLALEPLYGNIATIIFMLGLFGASFSSLIGNATIGGSLLSDAFSWGNQLQSKAVRRMIMLVMLIGAAIALKFGRLPLELIVFAQAITRAMLSCNRNSRRLGDETTNNAKGTRNVLPTTPSG
jgi:Mn2+/Fe2+ NRAMP family transporter